MLFSQDTRPVRVSSPLGPDVLLFHRLQGEERLGVPFRYTLDLLSSQGAIDGNRLLGERMTVALTLPDGNVRYFNGSVARFAQLGTTQGPDRTLVHYQAILHPWLWLLTQTANCRIFQHLDAPAIVAQVFRDHGFTDYEVRLSRTYPPREYCVQYRETDFQFVSRLLEEEGIYYFFEHAKDKHTLILADGPTAHKKLPGYETVPYFEPGNVAGRRRDHLYAWSLANEIQPGCCVLTDFDFTKPRADLRVKRAQPQSSARTQWEVFDYPGRYTLAEHGEHYARTRLEAFQAQSQQVQAEGNARGLACGALFALSDHPRSDQNRDYLIIAAAYRLQSNAYLSDARDGEEVHCALTALDSRQPYRPPRTTDKPCVRGPQTALVVGPQGEEIYTDRYGRVKVQFHWDREGQRNENSSCWVRVSHPWAGKGWGAVSIPRIGQEVIVDFLEGDPDQPIITGRVYNAESMPPFALPGGAVISGIKSNTHKGRGYNEISLDDTAGKEKVTIHAQYDMNTVVEHNQTNTVNNDFTEVIKNNASMEITQGTYRHDVKANTASYHVKGDLSENYDSNQTTTVGTNQVIHVGSNQTTTVGQVITVQSQSANIVIQAATSIELHVGASRIFLDSAGNISINGVNVAINGSESVSISGNAIRSNAKQEHEIKGAIVKSEGSATNTIKGAMVMLNP